MMKYLKNPIWFSLIIGLMILTYPAVFYTASFYFSGYGQNEVAEKINAQYRAQITQSTDPQKTARLGMVFLKTDNLDLAELAFSRTTALDPNWRDGWIWRGYTELALEKPQEALESLKAAEKLDPVYAFTYQLLDKAYTGLGNSSEAQHAREKMTALNK